MDQPFGQSMFDMSKGATFTLPVSFNSFIAAYFVKTEHEIEMNIVLNFYGL